MYDVLLVHVLHAHDDLLGECGARSLGQHELVLDHPIEQLPSSDTVQQNKNQ